MGNYDCIVLTIGAVNAGTASTETHTVQGGPNGERVFHVTKITAEEPCLVNLKAGGRNFAGQGSGIHVIGTDQEEEGFALPGFVFLRQGEQINGTVTPLYNFSAAAGYVGLHGYWVANS